jgi:hypothetical protein
MSGEGQARLGELRRRQGRFDEPPISFDQAGHHPVAVVGRVALHLDRGEPRKAMDLADRYLRQLPAHNRTERRAALEPLVRACTASGALDRAAEASRDLDAISREAPCRICSRRRARRVAMLRPLWVTMKARADRLKTPWTCFTQAARRLKSRGPGSIWRVRSAASVQTSAARDEVRRAVRSLGWRQRGLRTRAGARLDTGSQERRRLARTRCQRALPG